MASEYKTQLTELFQGSGISGEQIDEVINIVIEQQTSLSPDEQLEEMINLLVISGDSTLSDQSEGAIGNTSESKINNEIDQNMNRFLNLFPDISPEYLKQFCQTYNQLNFDELVEELSQTAYKKVDKDPLDIWEHLKQMLPDADPIYLRNHARALVSRPSEELEQFVDNAIEKHDYPSMQDYLKNEESRADFDLYLNRFSVVAYLERVPNPLEFLDDNYKSVLCTNADEKDVNLALNFLYNQFPYHRKTEIEKVFKHFNMNLIKVYNRLKCFAKAFRHSRRATPLMESKNVELLKEIAFLKHEKEIRHFLKQQDERYKTAFTEAQAHGLLQTCLCCFDDQLIPEECYFCNKNCTFCKECVKRGAEHVIGKEETTFPCLADCDSYFNYTTLKIVLDRNTFEKLCRRKQIEDIRNANIDGLETCPFCDFCMIPSEGDKVFKCRNVECMAETCRLCWHKAHVPLRCNEIEYDEDVKMRTYIENKMTEALLRQCSNCSTKFYKTSGCNKMTCKCGVTMCYVCGESSVQYPHFGNGRCPLYTENLPEFHLNRVRTAAEIAKNELGVNSNPLKLKIDPTKDLERDVM